MNDNAAPKPTIFISYSHNDESWKDRIVTHLGVPVQEGFLDTWDDSRRDFLLFSGRVLFSSFNQNKSLGIDSFKYNAIIYYIKILI